MKIVGLVPFKNESKALCSCLKGLAPYVDATVCLDDNSTDDSCEIVRSLETVCRVEALLKAPSSVHCEGANRNHLLDKGRVLGGTHFVVVDVDEQLTATCMLNAVFKEALASCAPGEGVALPWLHLWRSNTHFRSDACPWVDNWRTFAFADNGASYPNGTAHVQRTPATDSRCLKGPYGLIHWAFYNWTNNVLKQRWYLMLLRILDSHRLIERYKPAEDETGLQCTELPAGWMPTTSKASDYDPVKYWRLEEMRGWVRQYGLAYFEPLLDDAFIDGVPLTHLCSCS